MVVYVIEKFDNNVEEYKPCVIFECKDSIDIFFNTKAELGGLDAKYHRINKNSCGSLEDGFIQYYDIFNRDFSSPEPDAAYIDMYRVYASEVT